MVAPLITAAAARAIHCRRKAISPCWAVITSCASLRISGSLPKPRIDPSHVDGPLVVRRSSPARTQVRLGACRNRHVAVHAAIDGVECRATGSSRMDAAMSPLPHVGQSSPGHAAIISRFHAPATGWIPAASSCAPAPWAFPGSMAWHMSPRRWSGRSARDSPGRDPDDVSSPGPKRWRCRSSRPAW